MKDSLIALFSGAGIGLLIGVLMGLAVSPVVGVIIGALASCLALILGLNETHVSTRKSLRIGAFGLVCVAGALGGIYFRAHNLLSPNLEDLKAQYLRLGFDQEQALAFIAYKEFGILDKSWRMDAPKAESGTDVQAAEKKEASGGGGVPALSLVERHHNTNLYSSGVDFSACRDLARTTTAIPPIEIVNNFTMAGGSWNRLARDVAAYYAPGDWAPVLLLIRDGVCAEDETRFPSLAAEALPEPAFDQRLSRQEIVQGFVERGGPLRRLAERVRDDLPERLHKPVLLMLQKEFGHDDPKSAL